MQGTGAQGSRGREWRQGPETQRPRDPEEGAWLREGAWPWIGVLWVGPGCGPPASPPSARGPGLLLLIALAGYTVKNAWKNEVSWSSFSGWLALPFSIFAGNLDSGKRVEETARRTLPPRRLPAALPGTRHQTPLPTPADPAGTPLGLQAPVPGALPAICPRTNRPPGFCPPLPSRRASAFCGRTGSCRAWMPSVDSPRACDRSLPGAE